MSQPNPELLGVDLAVSVDRDIAMKARDFATIGGVENVVRSFIRQLLTPYGYLARFVYDVEGVHVVDEEYGNPVYLLLSEPLTPAWINAVISGIYRVADNEPRVELLGVDYVLVPTDGQMRVRFSVLFRVVGDPREFNVVLSREGSKLSAALVG